MTWHELAIALPGMWQGVLRTLILLVTSVAGGLCLGTILAILYVSNHKILASLAKLYVNFFRSVPLLLVLFWLYFAVPLMYKMITGQFLMLDTAFTSAVVAFILFEAAYFAEVVRAGIQSIPSGQFNAAYALGMRPFQVMSLIILPQAFRKMLPLVLQQSIVLFQDTTIVFAIGLSDFFRSAYVRGELMGLLTPYILLSGFFYFVFSSFLSWLVYRLKRKIMV